MAPVGAGSDTSDEVELWRAFRATGSLVARERLFSLHLDFARQVAKRRYARRSGPDIEFADVYQLACAGLLEAIDRYDPDRGIPFRGYAARRISGSVLDGIAKTNEVREQISFRARIRAERARSLAAPSADGLAPDQAMQALADLAVGLALGFMLEETAETPADRPSDPAAGAYESLAWKETVAQLAHAVSHLGEREQTIIKRHYSDGLTFEQVGALLGVSKGRVSQLHKAALTALKQQLPRDTGFRWKG